MHNLTGNQKVDWPQNLEVKGNQIFKSSNKPDVNGEYRDLDESSRKFELRSLIDLKENSAKTETLDTLAKAVEGVAETLSTVITTPATTATTATATTPPTTTPLLMFVSNQGNNCFFR